MPIITPPRTSNIYNPLSQRIFHQAVLIGASPAGTAHGRDVLPKNNPFHAAYILAAADGVTAFSPGVRRAAAALIGLHNLLKKSLPFPCETFSKNARFFLLLPVAKEMLQFAAF